MAKRCARPGCENYVKKATAKYCSVACSSVDPARREALRRRAYRAPVLPMAKQLALAFSYGPGPEAVVATLGGEDCPWGLARLERRYAGAVS
jgi:hypothetical protein